MPSRGRLDFVAPLITARWSAKQGKIVILITVDVALLT
jgi:hypothetical protein